MKVGDTGVLYGLIDYPQFNGDVVRLTGTRPCTPNEFCPSGLAFYFEGSDLLIHLDWVYSERVKPI